MPAWQKRQPRVQPRWISMAARLWTVSMKGTMKLVVGGGIVGKMRLTTVGGAASSIGSTCATVPSS
jgi:hypothetical protein